MKLIPKKEMKTIRFAIPKSDWAGLGLIAIEKGFFKQQGLNIEVSYVDAGIQAMEALISNSADFVAVVDKNIVDLDASVNKNISIVASTNISTASAIIARKSAGIRIPEDLKGKRLAISPGTTSEAYAEKMLQKYGLSIKDIDVIKIPADKITDTIISKSVDAISTWEPWASRASRTIGDDAAILKDPEVYAGNMFLGASKEFANNNKATVVKFLKAMEAAADFVKNNPSEAQVLLANIVNMDLSDVQDIWLAHDYNITFGNKYHIDRVIEITRYLDEDKPEKVKWFPNYPNFFEYFNSSLLLGLALLLLTWQIVSSLNILEATLFPSPAQTFASFIALFTNGSILKDMAFTLWRVLSGFSLAAVTGVLVGLVIGTNKFLYKAFEGLIDFFRSIPVVTLYPIFLLLFGIGDFSKIAMVFWTAFWVITLNTAYGVKHSGKMRKEVVKVFKATKSQAFKWVTFYEALPQTLIGMKIGLSFALLAEIMCEIFMGANYGIGQRISEAFTKYSMPELYSLVILTGILGILINMMFTIIERKSIPWVIQK